MSVTIFSRWTAAAIFLMALPCLGCGALPATERSDGRFAMVVTQVPAGEAGTAVAGRLPPDTRYPTGSRIVMVPPGAEPEEVRLLSKGLAAAGGPDVSPGADSVLFAGRRNAGSRWAIYESDLQGGRPRIVLKADRDCLDPAHLPAGRIVLVCQDDPNGSSSAMGTWSLYTATRSGSRIERITFGPGSAFDPAPLRDGRILFSMEQGTGVDATALYTVNPDGTLLEAFTGVHALDGLRLRARQTWDKAAIFLVAGPGEGGSRVERVRMSRPMATLEVLPLGVQAGTDSSPARSLMVAAVEPLPDGGVLVTGRTEASTGAGSLGVFRSPADGLLVEKVFDARHWDEVEAIPLTPAPSPRGRPSAVDPERSEGAVVCYDVEHSDGLVGPPRDGLAVATVEFQILETRPAGLGSVKVEEDGSFYAQVPADRPIRVLSFDADGQKLATSSWFWVRPGEVRACFGCHESRESAPVNRTIAAISSASRRRGQAIEAPGP